MPTCMTFRSPGPPWYATRCRKEAGHEGDCDFGTMEEAKAKFYADMAASHNAYVEREAAERAVKSTHE